MEVGSEMYKEGIRWTELVEYRSYFQLEPDRTNTKLVVLDCILTMSMTILQEDSYHDRPETRDWQ